MAREVELEAYDTPAFHDRLVRAAAGGQFRPWQVVEGLTGLAGALIGIAGITLAYSPSSPGSSRWSWRPCPAGRRGQGRRADVRFHRTTQAERRRNYFLYMLLSGKDAAKELRAFGLGDFLRERFDRLYDEHTVELRKVARAAAARVAARQPWPPRSGSPGSSAALLVLALNGRIGLADAGTAAGAVFVLGERLMNAVFSAGMLYESSLFIETSPRSWPWRPRSRPAGGATEAPTGFRRLRLEDVSFTYPAPPPRR